MTSPIHRFEQSEVPPTQTSQLSLVEIQSMEQVSNLPKRSTTEPINLVMDDIWSKLEPIGTEVCPPTPKDTPTRRVEVLPDVKYNPIREALTDDPSRATFQKLRFGKPDQVSNFSTDEEAKTIRSDAEKGSKHAEMQDTQWAIQWNGSKPNDQIAAPKFGDDPNKYTHVNLDQSSYTVTNGRISDFKTAATVDQPDGVTYSNIKYDSNGLVESYSNSLGQAYTRTDEPGSMKHHIPASFATWNGTSNESGLSTNYEGSNKWNVQIDTNGIHILVGSGRNVGTLFSRQLDGSQVLTTIRVDGDRILGLDTVTTLPDNTKVSQKTNFLGHSESAMVSTQTVDVKDANGKYYLDIPVDLWVSLRAPRPRSH